MATTMTEIPIKDLALTTAPAGKQLLVRDASAGLQRIDYDQIAKNLVESYGSSSLAGKNQSIKAAIDSLNNSLTQKTVDYIIKQDTEIGNVTGIGEKITQTYRKQASGTAECQGQTSSTRNSTPWGNLYLGSGADPFQYYPKGLFAYTPTYCINIGTDEQVILTLNGQNNKERTASVCPCRPISFNNMVFYVKIYAIGRWK